MARVELLLPHILKWEGGFVVDPIDKGGATNMGVTLNTYTDYRKKKGLTTTVNDLKNITLNEVKDILKTLYWDRWKADEIFNQNVANILVDWVYNSGVHGITIPQKILGVLQDGIVGPKTLTAVNSRDPRQFFEQIKCERKNFYYRIVKKNPSQGRFLKGWLNRINDFKFQY